MSELRALISAGRYGPALRAMARAAETEADPNELLNLARRLDEIPPAALLEAGFLPKRIAVLGGYTTQLIAPLLRAMLLRHRVAATVLEGDYGTFEQAIYARDERIRAFKPDLCYLCVGAEHLGPGAVEAELARWQALWEAARRAFGCDLVQNTFEEPLHRIYGSYELKCAASATRRVRRLNLELAAAAPGFVHLNDADGLAAQHGRRQWRDEKLYDESKIPVAFERLPAYARQVADVAAAVFGRSRKCLVLDLDNTLWGGVIGDDGVSKIQIGSGSPAGEAHARFQAYVRGLKDRGVILAVCSKNEEATAREPFAERKEMVLKLEDISCFVANWQPKPDNIARIARELNIGLDSLVFVDDNPAEREIVRQTLPEVEVIELPPDPSDYALALSRCGLFETVAVTGEDLARTEQYRANRQREELEAGATDYPGFLRSLEMRAVIEPFDELNLPRIHQLINKTNQFNVTTRRYTEAELRAVAARGDAVTRYVKLADRFGDNGLISVLIGFAEGESLRIDTWLMSCRVLKRGVEGSLFENLLEEARRRGLRSVLGAYLPTPKNAMVSGLFAELGFESVKAPGAPGTGDAGATHWRYDVARGPGPARAESIRRVAPGEY